METACSSARKCPFASVSVRRRKFPKFRVVLVPGESLYWFRGVHLSDTLINHPVLAAPKQGWGGTGRHWGRRGSARCFAGRLGRLAWKRAAKSCSSLADPLPPRQPLKGGFGWGRRPGSAAGWGARAGAEPSWIWGVGTQLRGSRANKPMEHLTSYYNLFLPELSCVMLNDTTGDLPLFKKIFHCLAAVPTLQKCKSENQGGMGAGLSSIRASKLFDNLELNSSIYSLSLLDMAGASISQLVAENHQLQTEKHVSRPPSPPPGAPMAQQSCSHCPPAVPKGDASLLSLISFSWLPSADASSPL